MSKRAGAKSHRLGQHLALHLEQHLGLVGVEGHVVPVLIVHVAVGENVLHGAKGGGAWPTQDLAAKNPGDEAMDWHTSQAGSVQPGSTHIHLQVAPTLSMRQLKVHSVM